MKKHILAAFLFFLAALPLFSAVADEYPFLDIDIGAKNTALAGAFTAAADDPSAVFVNPAGLASIKNVMISGLFDKWLLDSSFQYVGVAAPAGPGVLGAGVIYSDMGIFKKRDAYGRLLESEITAYNIGGGVSYGMKIMDLLSAGAGIKALDMTLGDYSSTGIMLDLGLTAKLGFISAGVSAMNVQLVPALFSSSLIRGGISADLVDLPGSFLKVSADIKYVPVDGIDGMNYSAAMEYTIAKTVSLRAGYRFAPENGINGSISGLCAGLSVKISGLIFDYSLSSRGDLGFTHSAGVTFSFESDTEKENKNYQKLTEFLTYQYFQEGQSLYDDGKYSDALRKFEQATDMMPDYPGLAEAKVKAKKMSSSSADVKKSSQLFEDGMKYYENAKYMPALKKWKEVKTMNPYYKDIDTWIQDAEELSKAKPASAKGEHFFSEGLKYYNNCDYTNAVDAWNKGVDAGGGKKIQQYIDRAKAKKKEMIDGLAKAKVAISKDTTLTEGIKTLRGLANTCPMYKDANAVLTALKSVIDVKSREYYYKGLDSYANGNLDAAIVFWRGIEDMDPKSDYVEKVKRYIEDARKKRKAVEKIGKQRK